MEEAARRGTFACNIVHRGSRLGSLIDSGKRLVVFLSTKADFTSVPYLIDGEHDSRLI